MDKNFLQNKQDVRVLNSLKYVVIFFEFFSNKRHLIPCVIEDNQSG